MVAIRLNTGQRIVAPNKWDQCTVDLFQKIISRWEPDKEMKDRSILKLFSIMIGIEIDPESDDDDLIAAVWECTRFIWEEEINFKSLPVPKSIKINGNEIEIPKKLGRLRLGQNMHVRQELQKVNDPNEAISIITAIYLQPLIDNSKFDYDRAKKIEQTILQMPIVKIYPIGFFFLKNLHNSGPVLRRLLNRMIQKIIVNVQLWLHSRKLNGLMRSLPYPL